MNLIEVETTRNTNSGINYHPNAQALNKAYSEKKISITKK
jgi:hypothetical protein